MHPSLHVYDNFAPDAKEVRIQVIDAGVEDFIGPNGEPYTNTSKMAVPQWHALLATALGSPVDVKLAGFRFDMAGEYPHNQVHADAVMGSDYAAVLYLNPPEQCRGGTAFYTHSRLGIDRLPASEELGLSEEGLKAWTSRLERDWQVQELWQLTGLAGMKHNRLIVYPTQMFHSRFPREGFGSNLNDGRMIWIAFFNCHP